MGIFIKGLFTIVFTIFGLKIYCDLQEYRKSFNDLSTKISSRNFTIDYVRNTFLKNGEPFRFISGSIHYFRIPEIYWRDRLMKAKAGGLNAIQFYVPWNFHEAEEGEYDFSGPKNVTKYLSIANELGFVVLFRSGPYICGEWDFGGLPAWLLRKNPRMKLRSSEPDFLDEVKKWYNVLLPIIRPSLYSNNGPIVLVQVENEYGSYYTCDGVYLSALFDAARGHLGENIILYTTDGNGYSSLKCGSSDRRLFTTVDFGASAALNPASAFSGLLQFQPLGPWMNSEFYSGWLDSWGRPHNHVASQQVVAGLRAMLNYSRPISINMYMYHGGTTFGYWNGVNNPPFLPQTTSYDYDAPISEAGDITSKFLDIRTLIQKFTPFPLPPVPRNTSKVEYGYVALNQNTGFLSSVLSTSGATFQYPVTMESLRQYQGYMLYATNTTSAPGPKLLEFQRVGDVAHIFTCNSDYTIISFVGRVNRTMKRLTIELPKIQEKLVVLVENSGHINFGGSMFNDVKGIIGNVTLAGQILTTWRHHPVKFDDSHLETLQKKWSGLSVPTQGGLYEGSFVIPEEPEDTFLHTGLFFRKGVLLVNGENLGRYWNSAGPQYTLFVPRSVLRSGNNSLRLFELEGALHNCSQACYLQFTANPNITGPVHAATANPRSQPLSFRRL